MNEETTVTADEAARVLTRLVNDRKALEKGAQIATALAGMERATQERKAELSKLDGQILAKQTELGSIDKKLRDKEFEHSMHASQVEQEHQKNVTLLEETLKSLSQKIAQSKEDHHLQEVELTQAHNRLVSTYLEEEQRASTRLQEVRSELEGLQKRAAILSGV
jgi:hypothetical protein